MRLRPARCRALLRRLAGGRVLVLGDLMLDEFVWGKVARISPEAPVPVVEIVRRSFHVGGAGNVAANVRALGGQAVLAGVVGNDRPGERLLEALVAAGVESAVAVARDDRPTTVKTRVVAHNQQVVRTDLERADDVSGELERELVRRTAAALEHCGALVVSDYHKGVVTARTMRALLPRARRAGRPALVDPKLGHFGLYRPATLVTPNLLETEQATGIRVRGEADLLRAGARLLKVVRCEAALVTRGEHGMSLFRAGAPPVHIPTSAREVYDVTGAGDTVIATLALALQAGASLEEAAGLANLAAGVVVGKVGTATATPDEVLAAVEDQAG